MTDAPKSQPVAAAAPDFQAKLEPLLKMVAHQGKEIIITQNGYPIARVTPYAPQPGDPDFPADWAAQGNPVPKQAVVESADQPRDEPPILEGFVNGKRFTLQIFGDIDGPMPDEWFSSPSAAEEASL